MVGELDLPTIDTITSRMNRKSMGCVNVATPTLLLDIGIDTFTSQNWHFRFASRLLEHGLLPPPFPPVLRNSALMNAYMDPITGRMRRMRRTARHPSG
jgi:hypothetical protein